MVVLIFGMLFFKDELSKSTVVPLRCLPCSIFTDSLFVGFPANCTGQLQHTGFAWVASDQARKH